MSINTKSPIRPVGTTGFMVEYFFDRDLRLNLSVSSLKFIIQGPLAYFRNMKNSVPKEEIHLTAEAAVTQSLLELGMERRRLLQELAGNEEKMESARLWLEVNYPQAFDEG